MVIGLDISIRIKRGRDMKREEREAAISTLEYIKEYCHYEYEKETIDKVQEALEQESVIDKIRSEIEQLSTSYVEIFTRHSGVKYRDMVELGAVTRIFDKHRAENGGK